VKRFARNNYNTKCFVCDPVVVVLVTHDRYLMDRVANGVLGLDGEGGSGLFADLAQWEDWLDARERGRSASAPQPQPARAAPAAQRKKLSYIEQREYDQIEQRIAEAEAQLAAAQAALQAPETVSDPAKLAACWEAVRAAQEQVDRLYARWAELEEKLG